MLRDDCVDLFKRIPERYHYQVNLVLRGQGLITVDTVVRFESTYLVLRGREGGSVEENRAFFVPYEEIAYLRVERALKLSELKKMYGETGYVDSEDSLAQPAAVESPEAEVDTSVDSDDSDGPAPIPHQDPVQIARQNLLERIRASRANVNAPSSSKLSGTNK
jgi:hypothetical protein